MSTTFETTPGKFKVFLSSKLGRRLCIISTAFTILAIILSIVMAQVYIVEGVSYDIPFRGNATTKIRMDTHYVDVDATAGTVTVDWYLAVDDMNDCGVRPGEVVSIYFNQNLLNTPDADRNASNNMLDQGPVYKFDTRVECDEAGRFVHNFDTFRTVAKMVGVETHSKWVGPSLQWYPWDKYFAQFSLFAQGDTTNTSVGMRTDPFGSPVNFNLNLDQKASKNNDNGLYLVFNVTRSAVVKLFVMIIVIANWVATIAFLWITVAACLWPETVVKEMFVIPIATLFAFTSVRSNMPGAPQGFGALIDFIGILPNIASMAIFSATLLLRLRKSTAHQHHMTKRDEW